MNYASLTIGDIRRKGDEWRHKDRGPKEGYICLAYPMSHLSRGAGNWWPVENLVGHPILASDLMHLDFRRPL